MDITLTKWTLDDLEDLLYFANNRKIAKWMANGFPSPYKEEDALFFIEKVSVNNRNLFAISVDGKKCGGIGLHPQIDIMCKNEELGYWLGEEYWGKGIVSHCVGLMVAYGFENLDIDRIFARPFGSNIVSQKVLEKCGFVLEARLSKTIYKWGQYEDELIYAVRKP